MWILKDKYKNENFVIADINNLSDSQKDLLKKHGSEFIDKYYSE